MRAIVLSGGGSRGAYQIGVWKALRKLNIKYDIVTGTSVGALNAALMTQNTFFRGLNFWRKLSFSDVLDEEIKEDELKETIYKKYIINIFNGGMKISNLERTVSRMLKIKKIYKSKINMGIITVKSKGLKPISITKNEIKQNELKDYLIASASCYPAFSKKKIKNEDYIDGGIYDNLPINLAIDMGATEIIAVDLESIGIKRKVENKNIPITYISPNSDIGSFLIFKRKLSRRAIRIGYNDTMKKFLKYDGKKYTFKKYELKKDYLKNKDNFIQEIKKIKNKDVLKLKTYKKILENKDWQNDYIKIIEQLGSIFEIDDSYVYSIKLFNKQLIKKINDIEEIENLKTVIKQKKIKTTINKKIILKSLASTDDIKYPILFPDEYLMSIYLKIIKRR